MYLQCGRFGKIKHIIVFKKTYLGYYPRRKMNLVVFENTARKAPNFSKIFKVHTELMKLVKNESFKK